MEWIALLLFAAVVVVLMAGFPVAFSLAGTALVFAFAGVIGGGFEAAFLSGMPSRIFGIMNNDTLVAVPLFVFMGVTAGARAHCRGSAGDAQFPVRQAARRPRDLRHAGRHAAGRQHRHRRGDGRDNGAPVAADNAETRLLGGDRKRHDLCFGHPGPDHSAFDHPGHARRRDTVRLPAGPARQGNFAPKSVSVGDLFAGALFPGLLLVLLYIAYLVITAVFRPGTMPAHVVPEGGAVSTVQLIRALAPPLVPDPRRARFDSRSASPRRPKRPASARSARSPSLPGGAQSRSSGCRASCAAP